MRNFMNILSEALHNWPEHATNADLVAMNREGDEDGYHDGDDTVYYEGRGATLRTLPVAGLHPGNDVDSDVVDIYTGMTTQAPPIIVDGDVVENGNHRLAAARARGDETILAYVLDA